MPEKYKKEYQKTSVFQKFRTAKTTLSIIIYLIIAGSTVTSCGNIIPEENLSLLTGTVSITVSQITDAAPETSFETGELYPECTILPTTVQSDFSVYTLVFSSDGEADVSIDRTNANLTDPVTLSAGNWDLTVTAFMDSGKTEPAAQGSLAGVSITAGQNASRDLKLKPIIEDGAAGTFIWNIGYPTEVTVASMTILPLAAQTGTPAQTLYFIGGTPIINSDNSSSPLILNTGYYQVEFNLSNGTCNIGRTEYMYIYKNMASRFACTFTDENFTDAEELPALTGAVAISGTAQLGYTLTANTGALGGSGAISYRWVRNGGAIVGTAAQYTLQAADVGSAITVTVSRSGNSGSVTSAPTAAVTVPATIRLPYYYPGTGVTYNGYMGTEGTLTTSGGVTVTYPSQTTFSADGFFTLEGTVNNPACLDYTYVELSKDSDPANLRTTWLLNGSFQQRIWLRFGAGTYTVKIHGLGGITLSSGGAYLGFSYYGNSVTFYVTNTRDEGDMRFIYPSYMIQSDDETVTGLASDLTSGLANDTAKIKAIHDYIIKNTVYDSASVDNSQRKKQDAVSVLGTRYHYDTRYLNGHFLAVCEGYANTFAALARAAGFQTSYVSSASMGHAWNNIFTGGAWKFMDVTWDDPVPLNASPTNIIDMGPSYVGTSYFLLANLNGIKNDHYGYTTDNGRSLLASDIAPWQRDAPAGWY